MESTLSFLQLEPFDIPMIIVGCVLVFVLWQLLEKVFFKPFMEMADLREAKSEGELARAKELQKDTEALRQSYEERLYELRVAMAEHENVQVNASQASAAKMIEEAESAAIEATEKARAEIRVDLAQALATKERYADDLAVQMIARLAVS